MTSQRASSTGTAAIVWDRSHLHHPAQRALSPPQPPVAAHGRQRHSQGSATGQASKGGMSAGQVRSAAGLRNRSPSMPESDLTMSFDPLKDLHLWTMWRVAVNGRIVDETRRRAHAQQQQLTPSSLSSPSSPLQAGGPREPPANPYGQALVKRPLDRFIKVERGSPELALLMMDPHGQSTAHLGTQQFVFYGVPRVVLGKKHKPQLHLP